jgi:hypothetical protein
MGGVMSECPNNCWLNGKPNGEHYPSCPLNLQTRMAAMLRSLEWAGGSCPECCVERYTGHAGEGMAEHLVPVEPPPHSPDCALAALLRELP